MNDLKKLAAKNDPYLWPLWQRPLGKGEEVCRVEAILGYWKACFVLRELQDSGKIEIVPQEE